MTAAIRVESIFVENLFNLISFSVRATINPAMKVIARKAKAVEGCLEPCVGSYALEK
jgi:hypothetical protein